MDSILIKDTTRAERESIVEEALGNLSGACDGCMCGIVEMYQAYIDGLKELREVNAEFTARYERAEARPERAGGCGMGGV